MTGLEHYVEAERLAEAYRSAISDAERMPNDTALQAEERHLAVLNAHALLTKAQLHADLAKVAVVAWEQAKDSILPAGQDWLAAAVTGTAS